MKTGATMPWGAIAITCTFLASFPVILGQNPPAADKEQEALQAWSDVDKQSITSLEQFLTKYTDSPTAADAQLFLSLARKVQAIKSGNAKPAVVIPFASLPEKWNRWKKEYAFGGAAGFKHTATGDTLFLPSGCMFRFDDTGSPVLPTNDGSILIFKSEEPNPRWADVAEVFLNGVMVQSEGQEPIYFAVLEKLGIVHLQGKCTVTMPDKVATKVQ